MKRVDILRAFIEDVVDVKIGLALGNEPEVRYISGTKLIQVYEYLDEEVGSSYKKETGAHQKIDKGKLVALVKTGWSPKQIAEEFSCSVATVYNYMARARTEGKL